MKLADRIRSGVLRWALRVAFVFAPVAGVVVYAGMAGPDPPPSDARQVLDIAIVAFEDNDTTSSLVDGFRGGMLGWEKEEHRILVFHEYRARGSTVIMQRIADHIARSRPSLVYVIGSPAAEAIRTRTKGLVIVNGASNQPLSSGASTRPGSEPAYVALLDMPPVATHLQVIRRLTPNVRTIGIVFNSRSPRSKSVVDEMRVHLLPGWVLREHAISDRRQLSGALDTLASTADAIFLPDDEVSYWGAEEISLFARQRKMPLFVSSDAFIGSGALASVSADHTKLGRQAARIAIGVLTDGEQYSSPVVYGDSFRIVVDTLMARSLRMDVTEYREGYEQMP
jgi:putative ABC transport system substrate-binding protein